MGWAIFVSVIQYMKGVCGFLVVSFYISAVFSKAGFNISTCLSYICVFACVAY